MTKLGIMTHSFDANWIPQIIYQDNNNGLNEDIDININENENYVEYRNDAKIKPAKINMKKNSSLGSMGTTVAGTQKYFYMDNSEN